MRWALVTDGWMWTISWPTGMLQVFLCFLKNIFIEEGSRGREKHWFESRTSIGYRASNGQPFSAQTTPNHLSHSSQGKVHLYTTEASIIRTCCQAKCSQTIVGSLVWIYSFRLPVGKRRKGNVNEKVEEKQKYLCLLPAFYFSRCKTLDYRTRSSASIITTHNWYPVSCLLRGIELNLYRTCSISHSQWFIGLPTSCPELDTEDMLSAHQSLHSNQPFLSWEKMGSLRVFSLETFACTAQCYK